MPDTDPCPALSIAVRAYAKRPPRPSFETANEADEDRPLKRVRRRYPSEALIFDTETLGDPAQQLMVGVCGSIGTAPALSPGRPALKRGFSTPTSSRSEIRTATRSSSATSMPPGPMSRRV